MENYIITDIESYAQTVRETCFNYLKYSNGPSNSVNENLDDYIKIPEIISLVTKKCELNENDQFVLNEEIHEDIFQDVCDWVYGIGLSKLVSDNLVECAWDDEQNCMVFWSPEKSNHESTAD